MAVRTQSISLPRVLLRLVMAPAALGALVATATALIKRYTHKPTVPPMSEDWLRSHDIGHRRDLPW